MISYIQQSLTETQERIGRAYRIYRISKDLPFSDHVTLFTGMVMRDGIRRVGDLIEQKAKLEAMKQLRKEKRKMNL